jgi:hypothetical protein
MLVAGQRYRLGGSYCYRRINIQLSSGMQFASPESRCDPGRSAELPYPQGANLRKVREVDEAVGRASAGREYGHRDRA